MFEIDNLCVQTVVITSPELCCDAYNLDYAVDDEPFNLAQQSGAFEIQNSTSPTHGQVLAQVVSQPPVDTCPGGKFQHPLALIGEYTW